MVKIRQSFAIDPEVLKKFREKTKKKGISMSWLIEQFIRNYNKRN